jgi:hypothetical protein
MPKAKNERRAAAERWDNEGGGLPAAATTSGERELDENRSRDTSQAAVDRSYESSPRGEHRYPDAHQPLAARQEREERDKLKRTLRGKG